VKEKINLAADPFMSCRDVAAAVYGDGGNVGAQPVCRRSLVLARPKQIIKPTIIYGNGLIPGIATWTGTDLRTMNCTLKASRCTATLSSIRLPA